MDLLVVEEEVALAPIMQTTLDLVVLVAVVPVAVLLQDLVMVVMDPEIMQLLAPVVAVAAEQHRTLIMVLAMAVMVLLDV